ncbi:uncharacterized protein LOC142236376 [Haematobia irritans]|uniref:uncharacterized protein LOC142236376 n=1 Tax=Haematobia irritans TaxID=7368 RepID=UPI003F4F428F
MDVFEEVVQSTKILENICKYLTLDDQIECLDINETFQYTIAKMLWKRKYHDLNIYKTPYINMVTNGKVETDMEAFLDNSRMLQRTSEPKDALTFQKCNVFLMNIARRVRNLSVTSEYINFHRKLGVVFKYIHLFENICVLTYQRIMVTDEHLEIMARYCLKLQKLQFIECIGQELGTLKPGRNFDIQHLTQMPQLRDLMIQCKLRSPLVEIDTDVLQEMFTHLKLRSLIMRNFKIIDRDADTIPLVNGDYMRVLNCGIISLGYWPTFKNHMKDFRDLRELTINVKNCYTLVNSSVLELVATYCSRLKRLSLENCDLYIEDFCLIKTLQHLSLLSCGGFTADNLHQVLFHLSLCSLSLINTRILGTIKAENHLQCSLELLVVDTIYSRPISDIFRQSLKRMESLHTIIWRNGDIQDSWLLDKCPQLRILHISNPYLIRYDILKMSSLEELSFTSCQGFSWNFLLLLIKNLRLKRLNWQGTETMDRNKEIPSHAYEVKTTLEKITIPYHIFIIAEKFWIDLLSLNRNLNLIFYGLYGDVLNTHFVRDLIRSPYVRDTLKHIRICGLLMDLDYMRNNFNETLERLNSNLSHFRLRHLPITIEL